MEINHTAKLPPRDKDAHKGDFGEALFIQDAVRKGVFMHGLAGDLAAEDMSTRSQKNIDAARREGANWAANAAKETMPCKLDAAILFPPAGNLVESVLSQLEPGGILVMAPVSASPITIENYGENLWGRDIRTLCNLTRADAEEFSEIIDRLELLGSRRAKTARSRRRIETEVGVSLFPFEELQDALILVKQGKLEQPNAVIQVADRVLTSSGRLRDWCGIWRIR